MATSSQLSNQYAGAITRFLRATGLTAAELAELAGIEPAVVFDAIISFELPSASDRARIAETINFTRRERGLA